jgi:hypothetical protein
LAADIQHLSWHEACPRLFGNSWTVGSLSQVKIKRMRLLLFLLICFVAPALAADLTGKWSIDGNMHGNPISFDCVFQQTEKNLRGSCKADEFSAALTGAVNDDVVQFSFIYSFAGEPYTCTYTGKLTGVSEIKGYIVITGIDGTKGEFVAKKS